MSGIALAFEEEWLRKFNDKETPNMLPTDAYFTRQWHLNNSGQDGARAGVDLNVLPVWDFYTGKGVKVGVYDGGVQVSHPDLIGNFDPALQPTGSGGAHDPDPVSGRFVTGDGHGTAVAGLILAARNGIGVVGVAYDATFGAVNLILSESYQSPDEVRDMTELSALNYQMARFDVINHSYGPGEPFEENYYEVGNYIELAAIDRSTLLGRDGLGTVHVVAAGNERTDGRIATDGALENLRYTVAVAAGSDQGDLMYYSVAGASLNVTAPVDRNPGGTGAKSVTTDLLDALGYSGQNGADIDDADYTDQMNGTSAAAPMVSGVVALMLEANPLLGYRDVQEILALTARANWQTGAYEMYDWQTNGASYWNGGGLQFSHDYGFGFVDALAAVRLAESWNDQRTRYNEVRVAVENGDIDVVLPDNTGQWLSFDFEMEENVVVEWAELAIAADHEWWGDLRVVLISPDGTESILLNRPGVSPGFNADLGLPVDMLGTEGEGQLQSIMASNAVRGEMAAGTWTVQVGDLGTGGQGMLEELTLLLYGRPEAEIPTYFYTDRYAALVAEDASRALLTTTTEAQINAAAVSTDLILDLNAGAAGRIAGTDFAIVEGSIVTGLHAGGGDDLLTANDLGNWIFGGYGSDTMQGGGGTDTLGGGDGHDLLQAGGAGGDLLDGNRGADTLAGGGGADELRGGKGHDRIVGDGGNDTLYGGLGDDVFAFGEDSGNDLILDFGRGEDRIEILAGINGTDIADAADLLARLSTDSAGNARLDLGEGAGVTLVGVDAGLLTDGHFSVVTALA